MSELYIQPNDLQKQIDKFTSTTTVVSELKYTLDKNGVNLICIDTYEECVAKMNELIAKFTEFAEMDANTLQLIKAEWMNADSEIATKTLGEIFFG